MSDDAVNSESELHPYLVAAYELNDTFAGLRHDVLTPFPPPADSHVHFDIWHQHELASRPECDVAVGHWLDQHVLPELSDGALFYLKHRFDYFAEFLRSLVLEDGSTILEYPSVDHRDFIDWGLIEWWESHGIREAYFEDLAMYEHQQELPPKT